MCGFVYDVRMSAPRCDDIAYITYLIASPPTVTCTEATRVQPPRPDAPAHDAFNRLLYRADSDPEALWTEAKPNTVQMGPSHGLLLPWVCSGPKPQGGHDSHATRTMHALGR